MMRASLLTICLTSSTMAFLGDWKVWSPSHDARMAAVLDGTAWVATSGGMLEWDLKADSKSSSRMHTRIDGLPTIDFASVVIDSQKTVWAIGTDGRIGYHTQGSIDWQVVGSYSSQGWRFAKRAALYWKGFLIFGTDHGLSLFSLKTKTAEDRASTFGTLTGSVKAIMVTPGAKNGTTTLPDTLWVALDAGLVHTTPDSTWENVGKAGHFLADPSQWTVDVALPAKDPDATLIRDANGVRLGDARHEWTDPSQALSISNGTVNWSAGSQSVAAASHVAAAYGSNVIVSSSSKGAMLVGPSGIVQTPRPEGNFPDVPPANAKFGPNGAWVARSENRVLTYNASTQAWLADTIRFTDEDGTFEGTWAFTYDNSIHRLSLAVGPAGELVVPSWGEHVIDWQSSPPRVIKTLGGMYASPKPGSWIHYASKPTDTCISYTLDGDYNLAKDGISGPQSQYGAALYSARASGDGVWLSALNHTGRPRIMFLPRGGETAPKCLEIPVDNLSLDQNEVYDLLSVGDTLWLASNSGLIRVPSPRPSYPPVIAKVTYLKPGNLSSLEIFRLAKLDFEGKSWIVGASNGKLSLFPTDGAIGRTIRTTLITSDSSATTLNQAYTSLTVDAQGQIWAAGDQGIDIVQLVTPEYDSLPPSFFHVRRITTADGLPENSINDMDLQVATGKALITTPSAIALWTSPYRPIPPRLVKSKVRVWPNPVRLRPPQQEKRSQKPTLFVDGATPESRFDLLAADGTLVMHLEAAYQVGGLFQIEMPAPSKLRPGLYFWSLKDKNGSVRGPLLIAE